MVITHSAPERVSNVLMYRPDIDGLRAVAALAVVCIHISHVVPGGALGVDIFFVISGFLISGIILRSLLRESFNFAEFYARRVRRIFPALIIVLLASWAIGSQILLVDEYRGLGGDMIAGALFFLNISRYLAVLEPDPSLRLMPDVGKSFSHHLWSLGVEEQFYIIWPLFLVTVWKLSRGRIGVVAAAIAATAVASLIYFIILCPAPTRLALLPWLRLWQLAAGGLLACAYTGETRSTKTRQSRVELYFSSISRTLHGKTAHHCLGFAGASFITAALATTPSNNPVPGAWAMLPVIGTCLLISAGPQSWVNRHLLASRPMVFIGLISYPIYLWHMPLLAFYHATAQTTPVGLALIVMLTLVLSYLTYRYVELPVRHSPRRATVAVRVGALMAAVACLGALVQMQIIHPRRQTDIYAQAATEDWLTESGDSSWTRFPGIFTLGSSEQRTLFWGDSALQQYYPRIKRLMKDPTLDHQGVIFATRFGCAPAVAKLSKVSRGHRAACEAHTASASKLADGPGINTIVIGACWSAYFFDSRFPSHPTEADGVDAAISELARIVQAYVREGKKVYVILGIPSGAHLDPRQYVPRLSIWKRVPAMNLTAEATSEATVTGASMARFRILVEQAGATIIDPRDGLCTANSCPALSSEGEPMYRDRWHLRPSYVRAHVTYVDRTVITQRPGRDTFSSGTR